MIRILFICHGSICRSPMSMFAMRDIVRREGMQKQFQINCAATSREEIGNPVYPPAKRKLNQEGIRCDGYAARKMLKEDYDRYDMIICMDDNNKRNIMRMTGGDPDNKISLLLDFTERTGQQVADPWYTGNFDATWRDVTEGCEGLLRGYGCR